MIPKLLEENEYSSRATRRAENFLQVWGGWAKGLTNCKTTHNITTGTRFNCTLYYIPMTYVPVKVFSILKTLRDVCYNWFSLSVKYVSDFTKGFPLSI